MRCAARIKCTAVIGAVVLWFGCEPTAPAGDEVSETGVAPWPEVTEVAAYAKYGLTKLSDYGFFEGALKDLDPAGGVIPYEVASPLFSDYAGKARFIYLPEGTVMDYHNDEVFEFPEGAALIKNFYFTSVQLDRENDVLLETRILLRESGSWKALPYLWNADQTEAFLDIAGGERHVALASGERFRYSIPNMQQCKTCHDKGGDMTPIGPVARQLNFGKDGVSQLEKWHGEGLLTGFADAVKPAAAVAYDDLSRPLDLRARAYLDANCAYCHRPDGSAKNSGLDLSVFAESDHALGIGKSPVAAGKGSGGLRHDIVPGHPDASIMVYRMQSTEPAVMMPELGRSLVHVEGLELIRAWIAELR